MKKSLTLSSVVIFSISLAGAKDLKLVEGSLLETIDPEKMIETSINVDWSDYPTNLPKGFYCFDNDPTGDDCDMMEVPKNMRHDAFTFIAKNSPYMLYYLNSNDDAVIAKTPKEYARVLKEHYESKNFSLTIPNDVIGKNNEGEVNTSENTPEEIAFCEKYSLEVQKNGGGSPSGNDFFLCLDEKLWNDKN